MVKLLLDIQWLRRTFEVPLNYTVACDIVAQIFLSMLCPLLIPFLITFDTSTEVTADSKVSPSDSKDTAAAESVTKVTVRRYIVRQICNVVSFYNAAIVKFCSHSVYSLIRTTLASWLFVQKLSLQNSTE